MVKVGGIVSHVEEVSAVVTTFVVVEMCWSVEGVVSLKEVVVPTVDVVKFKVVIVVEGVIVDETVVMVVSQ